MRKCSCDLNGGVNSGACACPARSIFFLAETPEAGQVAGQALIRLLSIVRETSPGFGSRPLT